MTNIEADNWHVVKSDMIARISFVLLAVLAPLAVAGPTAWFSSSEFDTAVSRQLKWYMADRPLQDDECTSTAFDEDNTVHKMDKVGANCLVLEPDRKAISVSGAKSWSGDDKPYCVYLSEGGYCDGETIAMDIQGKSACETLTSRRVDVC